MRLFVAVEVPEEWRRVALDLQRAIPGGLRRGARLVDGENLHVTLRFIGEVEEGDVPRLRDALERRLPPVALTLRLGGPRTFGAPGRTSSVWLAVEGDLDALYALHVRTNEAVEDALGLPFEEGRYTPHVTLARVRNRASAEDRRRLAEWAQRVRAPEAAPFAVEEAVLVRSRLGDSGPHYETVARFS